MVTDERPGHVGDGLSQGLMQWRHRVEAGSEKLQRKPREGLASGGAVGAALGAGQGFAYFWADVARGACDFTNSALEGVRRTPDTIADALSKERPRHKYGIESEGQGDVLATFITGDEPAHFVDGLLVGSHYLGYALGSGVRDLRKKVVEGAEKGRIEAAIGFSEGTLGLSAKTAAGSLDFVTCVVSGIKNTPHAIDNVVKSYQRGTRLVEVSEERSRGWNPEPRATLSSPSSAAGVRTEECATHLSEVLKESLHAQSVLALQVAPDPQSGSPRQQLATSEPQPATIGSALELTDKEDQEHEGEEVEKEEKLQEDQQEEEASNPVNATCVAQIAASTVSRSVSIDVVLSRAFEGAADMSPGRKPSGEVGEQTSVSTWDVADMGEETAEMPLAAGSVEVRSGHFSGTAEPPANADLSAVHVDPGCREDDCEFLEVDLSSQVDQVFSPHAALRASFCVERAPSLCLDSETHVGFDDDATSGIVIENFFASRDETLCEVALVDAAVADTPLECQQ